MHKAVKNLTHTVKKVQNRRGSVNYTVNDVSASNSLLPHLMSCRMCFRAVLLSENMTTTKEDKMHKGELKEFRSSAKEGMVLLVQGMKGVIEN